MKTAATIVHHLLLLALFYVFLVIQTMGTDVRGAGPFPVL